MNPTIKVVKKSIKAGWFSQIDFDEDKIAMEIQGQEDLGWQLVSHCGLSTKKGLLAGQGNTDAIVFIYRKK